MTDQGTSASRVGHLAWTPRTGVKPRNSSLFTPSRFDHSARHERNNLHNRHMGADSHSSHSRSTTSNRCKSSIESGTERVPWEPVASQRASLRLRALDRKPWHCPSFGLGVASRGMSTARRRQLRQRDRTCNGNLRPQPIAHFGKGEGDGKPTLDVRSTVRCFDARYNSE